MAVGFFLPDQGLTSLAAIEWSTGDLSKAAETAAAQEQEKIAWERDYAMTTVTGVALRLRQMQAGQGDGGGHGGRIRRNSRPTSSCWCGSR